jgi:hypothetical protein
LLALLGVLAEELHLAGQGVAALLHGLPFVAVLEGAVVDGDFGFFDGLLKRAVLGL